MACIYYNVGYKKQFFPRINMTSYAIKGPVKDGSLRLVNEIERYHDDFNAGNVEIYHNGSWGSICNQRVDQGDGLVICRQLGYPNVINITHTAWFGANGYIMTWLTNISCTGNESKVTDCPRQYGWESPSACQESNQISVWCQGIVCL